VVPVPALNFYREVKGLRWLKPIDRRDLGQQADYCCVSPEDVANLPVGAVVLLRDSATGNVLARGPGRQAAAVRK